MAYESRRELQTLVGQLEVQVAGLQAAVNEYERADRLTRRVRDELGSAAVVSAIEEDADTQALVAVVAEEKTRLSSELAVRVKGERYDELAADVRTTEGPRIIADLRTLFETDGTFDELRRDAERAVASELQQELIEAEKQRVTEELNDPEYREAIREQLKKDIKDLPELEAYRNNSRSVLENDWSEDLRVELEAEIEAEELGRKDEYKSAKKEELKTTRWANNLRESTRSRLQDEWGARTSEEVAAEVEDEELRDLLVEKANLEKESLKTEVAAQKLLRAFEGRGVETDSLVAGTRLEIFLGTIKDYEVAAKVWSEYYQRHEDQQVVRPGVECRRKLTLLANEGGNFIVDDDTLLDSTSEYERNDALKRGTIIEIGRHIRHNGDESLEHRIVYNVPLYYDDDTSEPHITDAKYPVANIIIDGVSAKEIAKVEMV